MKNIDLHRHYGGCISPDFVWSVLPHHTLDDIKKLMQFTAHEKRGFYEFLSKFHILDTICWTEELVEESIIDVCTGLIKEKIDYTWIDCSINKFMNIGWSCEEAIQFIHDCFQKYFPDGVGIVLSLKYESSHDLQRQFADIINTPSSKCLIGIDLVGDEAQYEPNFYCSILRDWVDDGKMVRAHLGESQSAENVKTAIEQVGVTNVAHGIKIIERPDVIELAKDRGIYFDLAITSNYLTEVWASAKVHPIVPMLEHGLLVTLGSDDPTQCSTTLANEFDLAKSLGTTDHQLEKVRDTALIAASKYNSKLLQPIRR